MTFVVATGHKADPNRRRPEPTLLDRPWTIARYEFPPYLEGCPFLCGVKTRHSRRSTCAAAILGPPEGSQRGTSSASAAVSGAESGALAARPMRRPASPAGRRRALRAGIRPRCGARGRPSPFTHPDALGPITYDGLDLDDDDIPF